jgi:predicted patatin/cPLA2 family phospholipase
MELSLGISILAVVITVANFVLSRKDKAVKDTKEENKESTNQVLIDYKLGELSKKVDQVITKLDSYERETKNIVKEEMEKHILEYHK